jgi:hypothetical protein
MNNFQNQTLNNQNQTNQDQTNQNQFSSNSQTNQPPSMMMKLLSSCLPVILQEFMGGQAMSPMGGNNAELQLVFNQAIGLLQQISVNQQALEKRITQLETNAVNQLTNLTNQVQSIKSIRLTHDRERKQIELGSNGNDFDKSQHYNLQQENN